MPAATGIARPALAAFGLAALCGLAGPLPAQTPDVFDQAVTATKARDYAQAARLFESLARTDDHDAQYNLAILLKAGEGRPQNYAQALEWAQLARLGGVERAQDLTDALSALVPQTVKDEVAARIDTHLQDRLAKGDRAAVMQYVAFNRTVPAKPDLQRAYRWALIGAALGIPDAAAIRDDIAADFDAKTISQGQQDALELFEQRNMTELFKPQPRTGS